MAKHVMAFTAYDEPSPVAVDTYESRISVRIWDNQNSWVITAPFQFTTSMSQTVLNSTIAQAIRDAAQAQLGINLTGADLMFYPAFTKA